MKRYIIALICLTPFLWSVDSIALGSPSSVPENATQQDAGLLTGNVAGSLATSFTTSDAKWTISQSNHLVMRSNAEAYDFETTPSVSISITASNGVTAPYVQVVIVTISNVNEAPITLTIAESSCNEEALGVTIGSLSATDPDAGSTFAYSVPNNSGYAINGTTLKLADNRQLDFEDSSVRGNYASRNVTVTVTDNGGLTKTLDVTVTPIDVNEAPTALTISNSSCAEETLGATIGNVSASDPDAGSTFTYSVPANSGYVVTGTALKLAADRKLDYEDGSVRGAYASRSVTVTVTDNGGLTKTLNVTVAPSDINEAPTGLFIANTTCNEETFGANIGTLSATDVDAGSTFTYDVPWDSGYRIVDVTGGKALALASDRKLDFEDGSVRDSYTSRTVTVTVTDNGGLTRNLLVTVAPANLNEAPVGLAINGSACDEEKLGATIGTLSATDPDAGDTRTFAVPANSGYRIVNGTTLALASDRKLDYEDASVRGAYGSRTVTVTVTDSGGLTATIDVTVSPNDSNEAPTALAISNRSCDEESLGAFIGSLNASDPDANSTFTYSVPVNSGYVISGSSLRLASDRKLDLEDSAVRGVYASRSVTVTVTDNGTPGLTTTLDVTVTPLNINEAPTVLTIATTTCDEETLGATIGLLSASDPDSGETLTFSVPGGSGYRIIDATGGKALALRDNRKLDVEDASVRGAYASRTVTVTVTDAGNLTKTLAVSVTPINVNDAPDSLTIATTSFPEETPGAVIGLLSATDPDVGDVLQFSVMANSGYRIVDATGGKALALAADRQLDLEDASVRGTYADRNVTVTVTDSGNLSKTLVVTVIPTNINEAPTALTISDVLCPEESAGATVGDLSVTDVDAGDSHIFSVPVDSGYRIIESNKLALAANRRLDTEDSTVRDGYASRNVVVTVTDAGGLSRTLSVDVVAEDANDPLLIAAWSSNSIALADLESAVAVAPGGAWFDQDPETPLTAGGGAPEFSRYHEMKLRFKLTNDQAWSPSQDSDTVDAAFHQLQFELPSGRGLTATNSGGSIDVFRGSSRIATIRRENGNAAVLDIRVDGDRASGLPRITRAELGVILQGVSYRCLLSSAQGVPDIFVECSTEHPWDGNLREWTGWRRILVSSANRRPSYTEAVPSATLSAQRGSVGQVTQALFAITDDYPQQSARLVVVSPPRSGRLEQLSGEDLPVDDQLRPFLPIAPAADGSQVVPYVLVYRPDTSSTAISDTIIVQVIDGGVPPSGAGKRASELVAIPVRILPGTAPSLNAVMDETGGRVSTFLEQGAPVAVVPGTAQVQAQNDPLGAWTLYLGPPVAAPGVFATETGTRYVVRSTDRIRSTADGGVECRTDSDAWLRIGTQSTSWTGIGRSLAIDLNPTVTLAQATQLVRALGVSRDGRRLPLARTVLPVGLGFVTTGVAEPNPEQISRLRATIGVAGVDDPPVWSTPNLLLRTTSPEELVGISEVRDPDGGASETSAWTASFSAVRRLRIDTERDPADDAQVYRCTWSVLPSAANGSGITFADGTTAVRQQITVQEVGVTATGLEFVSDAPYFQRLGERHFVPLLLTDGVTAVTTDIDLFLTFPTGTSAVQRDVIVNRIRPIPASGQLLLDFTGIIGGELHAGEVIDCSLVANRRGQADGTAVQPIKLKLLPDLAVRGLAQ